MIDPAEQCKAIVLKPNELRTIAFLKLPARSELKMKKTTFLIDHTKLVIKEGYNKIPSNNPKVTSRFKQTTSNQLSI